MGDRTSIPCSNDTRDELAEEKPENMTWDAFLMALASDAKVEHQGIHSNSPGEKSAELVEEINRLRRELDEFKHNIPAKVAEELR